MALILKILVPILIFSLVVLIHELGHFWMARRAGIKVEEFGIGLPPRLFGWKSKRFKDMIWSINWIPFGGFVRLYGEDATDNKLSKDSKSFSGKTVGQRFKVVVAGVVMNFLLAFILLSIGFSIGIKPLMLTGEDFLSNLEQGNVVLQQGVVVKEVQENSYAWELGFREGDRLVAMDGVEVMDPEKWVALTSGSIDKSVTVQVARQRTGESQIKDILIEPELENFNLELHSLVIVPRVVVHGVEPLSTSYYAGLKQGDIILQINDKNVYSVENYNLFVAESGQMLKYKVWRDTYDLTIQVPLSTDGRVVVVDVVPESTADKLDFQKGDLILEINGEEVYSPSDIQRVSQVNKSREVDYKIQRNSEILSLKVFIPDSGYIGVYLTPLISHSNYHLSVYPSEELASALEVKDVQYSVLDSPVKAWQEMSRLSVLTAKMFTTVIAKIVGDGEVPEGVAGPVGIARMTYVFMKEGLASLIRFTAFLSLSLAVINILPLPALDGGRLVFISLEALCGKPIISPKWETRIHGVGFVLLIMLILFVTYNDILQAIRG